MNQPGLTKTKLQKLELMLGIGLSLKTEKAALEAAKKIKLRPNQSPVWQAGYVEGLKLGIQSLERILDTFD